METIADLKEYLQNIIDTLEMNYDDEAKLDIRCNTYRMGNKFISTPEGFIDFRSPVEDYEDEEDYDD